jgi:FkbM family methyltransferase
MVKLWLRLLRKFGLLRLFNLTFSWRINGRRFRIPLYGNTGFELFIEKEPWMSVVLKPLISLTKDGAFIDVGVNLGQTLLVVKSVKADMPYVGFEPNPVCLSYLTSLLKLNRLSARIFPVALAEKNGLAKLYRDAALPADSSATILENFREKQGTEHVYVPVYAADDAAFASVIVGIIKIDVEGGELEVIKSLFSKIRLDRPYIICEILPVYDTNNTFRLRRQNEILTMLAELQYVIFRIHVDGKLQLLKEIGIHGRVQDSNYLFIPAERQSAISQAFNV